MKTTFETYIEEQPEDAQIILRTIRDMVISEFPNVEEKYSWNMPLFYLKGNITWFANCKSHIGMYPEPQVIFDFADKLVEHKTSKGSIQFKKKGEFPYELVMEIIRAKVKMNLEKESK